MSQIETLVALIRDNEAHRTSLQQADSPEALVELLVRLAEIEGLYIEPAVIEAAVIAAHREDLP